MLNHPIQGLSQGSSTPRTSLDVLEEHHSTLTSELARAEARITVFERNLVHSRGMLARWANQVGDERVNMLKHTNKPGFRTREYTQVETLIDRSVASSRIKAFLGEPYVQAERRFSDLVAMMKAQYPSYQIQSALTVANAIDSLISTIEVSVEDVRLAKSAASSAKAETSDLQRRNSLLRSQIASIEALQYEDATPRGFGASVGQLSLANPPPVWAGPIDMPSSSVFPGSVLSGGMPTDLLDEGLDGMDGAVLGNGSEDVTGGSTIVPDYAHDLEQSFLLDFDSADDYDVERVAGASVGTHADMDAGMDAGMGSEDLDNPFDATTSNTVPSSPVSTTSSVASSFPSPVSVRAAAPKASATRRVKNPLGLTISCIPHKM